MAVARESDFEKMTMEEAYAHYADPQLLQRKLRELASKSDTCGVCGVKPDVMKAGYYHDGTSIGLPRAMCEPCRAANQQRAVAGIPRGTQFTHQYSPWRGSKK